MTGDTHMDSQVTRAGVALIGLAATLAGAIPEPVSAAGFPAANCRSGFRQAGPRLCISENVQAPAQFDTAMRLCRSQRAYVASYGDLYYLYVNTNLDANYNPNGRWIGPDLIADDRALCGNVNVPPNQENFEGTCNKNDVRAYWCAHDDDGGGIVIPPIITIEP
jgi:hypothetical protein